MKKALRPYIAELLVFILICLVVAWYIFVSGYVVIRLSVFTVLAAATFAVWVHPV